MIDPDKKLILNIKNKNCEESIKKLKSLRAKLCNQQSTWKEAFKSRF